mmetsp:Transcript_11376/g.17215  ORF Transcript_11376/g.17215 Transcript_11376/m.17215 type:complete len:85 (-) Transcript_11376:112-366(-)
MCPMEVSLVLIFFFVVVVVVVVDDDVVVVEAENSKVMPSGDSIEEVVRKCEEACFGKIQEGPLQDRIPALRDYIDILEKEVYEK